MTPNLPSASPALRALCAVTAALLVSQLFLADADSAAKVTALIADKAAHMLAFGALALLAWTATGGRSPLAVFAFVLAVGIADETVQSFTPRRHGEIADLAADAFAAAAILTFLTLKSFRRPLSGARPVPTGG